MFNYQVQKLPLYFTVLFIAHSCLLFQSIVVIKVSGFLLADCCGPDTVLKQDSLGYHCVYPIKLDFLLLNVSSNPNWNLFLELFASQLGLWVSQIDIINFHMVSLSRVNIFQWILLHIRELAFCQ